MIIENPDVFKTWLTSILEPLCDADPAALAKYVYALVKKEKPISELRDVMVDQLDVFLQQDTKPFVEMLFTSLESNDYLKPREVEAKPPTPPPESEPEKEVVEENHASNGTSSPARVAPQPPPPRRVVVTRAPVVPAKRTAPQHEQTLVKVLPLTELLEEPVEQPPRRRDRRNDQNMRDKEDRRRRRSRSADRRVRARRDHERRHEPRRLASRSPSPRRYRNRSPPPGERQPSRSRSRSPVGMLRDRDMDRERDRLRIPRELERDKMSRDREHRERVSRSRERERSRDRSRDRSRGSSPRDPRLDNNDAFKRRCRDFDEKGYCMRGDLCQWDHGVDPVVLEDAALSSVLTMPHPVPEYNPLAPDIWMGGFPPYPHPHPSHPPRELIPIPRVRHAPPPGPLAPLAPRPPHPHPHPHPPQKKNFDYNRIGMRPPLPASAVNCSLEVKKVPRGMNDITHLNNHFSKFGKIVNIQVCYEGDPEAAIVTFSNPTEANVAYKSTEAVLNNRFIKVFWHNPDSKQENTAPSNQIGTERAASQHPMSHNKVFINKDNVKATQDTKAVNVDKDQKVLANGTTDVKKEAPSALKATAAAEKSKRVMEMYKRGRELLQTHLTNQRQLIQKLESGNVTGAQKTALMDAINSAQEAIEKLRKELVAYNGTMKQMQDDTLARMSRLHLNQINAKKPKTREEAQKEILDAELDMFTKQQEGQDVTDLLKKITELRRQMALSFPVHSNARRPVSARGGRFNPSMRFTRSSAPAKAFSWSTSTTVDHRPRALLISGFETDDLQPLTQHFSQFGEVSSKEVDLAVPQLLLAYKVRAHAEQAMAHGKHYNDRTLTITWAQSSKPAATHEMKRTQNGDASDELREEPAPSEATLLRSDEEDDDETHEARSWRH